nr:MAG TPA: hypothetical protein [Caudoviricetes sp.]
MNGTLRNGSLIHSVNLTLIRVHLKTDCGTPPKGI